MARGVWQNNIQTGTGDIVPGASIDVVNEATGLEIDVYAARTGGSVLSQPLYADANGYIKFYVEPSRIRVTATGVAGSQTFRDQLIMVPQESSTDATADRMLTVGAFGLGNNPTTTSPQGTTDPNTLTNGSYMYNRRSDGDTPPAFLGNDSYSIVMPFHGRLNILGGAFVYDVNNEDMYVTNNLSSAGDLYGTQHRLLKQGDYGLGGANAPSGSGVNLDTLSEYGWSYQVSPTNAPPSIGTIFTIMNMPSTASGGRGSQLAQTNTLNEWWVRAQSGGTWSAWVQIYTEANYQPEIFTGLGVVKNLVYTNASAVANGVSTAGSEFQYVIYDALGNRIQAAPAVVGTWLNVSGQTVGTNYIGQFVRIA